METIAKVRRMHHKEGLSQRAIALKLNISRSTVRKYLDCTELPTYQREVQPFRQLGEFIGILNIKLNQEALVAKSKRMSSQRLFEWLRTLGYEGGYGAVCNYVKQYNLDYKPQISVFIPQQYAAGDAYQFDWSTEVVKLDGQVIKIQVAHFKLCYSRALYVRAYFNQKMEMLIDAHNHAFAAFGGVPRRGIYDNMKTAVKRIGIGKEREFNDQFLGLMNHYLIEPVACTPASGWEKGQVERQVRTIRKRIFEPMLSFTTLDELNRYLADQCQLFMQDRCHPADKSQTIAEYHTHEQTVLSACTAYPCGRTERTKVNSFSLVNYDNHRYSVPCQWVGQTVTLHVTASEIKVMAQAQVIAVHPRSFEKNKPTYNPWHYLKVLERKPGALRNGEPFNHWPLPKAVKLMQVHLLKQANGDRAMVKLLSLIAEYGEELGVIASEIALEEGMPTVEAVLNIIHRLKEPPIPQITCYEVPLQTPPKAQLSRFDSLLTLEVRNATT